MNAEHLKGSAFNAEVLLGVVNHGLMISFITLTCTDGQQLNKQYRGRRNRWAMASIFTVGPVKLNKDRPAGPVDILGPLGPATFVSSVSFNID
jgi:hypothetical protein